MDSDSDRPSVESTIAKAFPGIDTSVLTGDTKELLGKIVKTASSMEPFSLGGVRGTMFGFDGPKGCGEPNCPACSAAGSDRVDEIMEEKDPGSRDRVNKIWQGRPALFDFAESNMKFAKQARALGVPMDEVAAVMRYVANLIVALDEIEEERADWADRFAADRAAAGDD